MQTLSQHRTIHGSGSRKGRKGRRENGWHGHYGSLASSSPDPSRAPEVHNTTGTCGSGGIRVLHADDGGGVGSRELASSVWNLDVDKSGAADSMTGSVM